MTAKIEFGPEEMVIIPLLADLKDDDEDIEIAMLEIDGRRTIPIYTKGADTSGFFLNDDVPLFWYEFNFRILVSMLDEENDLLLVNMGTPDEHVFDLKDLQRTAPEPHPKED